jgi:Putative beta barrel porin-7 (BBP7)
MALLLSGNVAVQAQQGLPAALPAGSDATGGVEPASSAVCPWALGCNDSTSCQPRFWVNADYLLWWVKSGPVNTPLVTTGSQSDLPPGALGQPGTQVLFGDHPLSYGSQSGLRVGGGVALNSWLALEGSYFYLDRGAVGYGATSDSSGSPLITRPFFNNQVGVQDSLGVSDPNTAVGPWAGGIAVASHTQLQGWEANLSGKTALGDSCCFSVLAGFRGMYLNEDLSIQENLVPLVPGVLGVGGLAANPPSTIGTFDRFQTTNNFYGGQIGGRLGWTYNTLSVDAIGKVALGVNQEIANVAGSSTLVSPAGNTTFPGGVLALPTNIGRHFHDTFSVVPEGQLNLGWSITPHIKATVGYNFVFWSEVARPGNQIDPVLNPGLIPTSQVFGNGQGAPRPQFIFNESNFWAQGITWGLEFKF